MDVGDDIGFTIDESSDFDRMEVVSDALSLVLAHRSSLEAGGVNCLCFTVFVEGFQESEGNSSNLHFEPLFSMTRRRAVGEVLGFETKYINNFNYLL